MDTKSYKIKVLHYLNPHLLWIEAFKDSQSRHEFFFEQIGIFGVLPLDIFLDLNEDTSIKTKKSREWSPGAVQVMDKVFGEAKELIFVPKYVDNRKTIFDDNIHKFGEILIKTSEGKEKKFSEILANTYFACYNVAEFYDELNIGLNTELSRQKEKEVIKALEKSDSKRLGKQTRVHREECKFELQLSEENLRNHDLMTKQLAKGDIKKILLQKHRDFELCKDIDAVSAGLATKINRNCIETEDIHSNSIPEKTQENSPKVETKPKENYLTKLVQAKKKMLSKSIEAKSEEKVKEKVQLVPMYDSDSSGKGFADKKKSSKKKSTRYKTNKSLPDYDEKTEKLVAYGPPHMDKDKLAVKVVPLMTSESSHIETEDVSKPIVDSFDEIKQDENTSTPFNVRKNVNNSLDIKSKKLMESVNNKNYVSLASKTEQVNEILTAKNNSWLSNRLKIHKKLQAKDSESSTSSTSQKDTSGDNLTFTPKKTNKNKHVGLDACDESEMIELVKKLNLKSYVNEVTLNDSDENIVVNTVNVNPFKNVDAGISHFVDKLVSPVLMVHSKTNKVFQPAYQLADVNFDAKINSKLGVVGIKHPMTLQTVSWNTILRGHSLFMISPKDSGKTIGYIPAICRLVYDFNVQEIPSSIGPIAIILCATANSVVNVQRLCKLFLDANKTVLSCFAGMNERSVTLQLLNGCHIFVTTPPCLVRLLCLAECGLDLRRLMTYVLDDCERLTTVYMDEIKYFLLKVKEMMRNRANDVLKVQCIVASRIWSEFIEALAKKVKPVVCIGAFYECVLYSKANMTVNIIRDNKIDVVFEFLQNVDSSKRTVIVCTCDDEVRKISEALKAKQYTVFSADTTMTLEDLYTLSGDWAEYQEPVIGPILVCCDDNLSHLNITNAHHLVHYSLPNKYSMFARRFIVLIDNYASMYRTNNEEVKIKIMIDETNVAQLPKILNFIKRCSCDLPESLNAISEKILAERDYVKAQKLVPFCDGIISMGECPDFWNCLERHSLFKQYDDVKDWVPKAGVITFIILHYETAVNYSVRLLSSIINGSKKDFPNTYVSLAMKMARYYSQEKNKRPLGIPKVGDICAVTLRQGFYDRCQVIKIVSTYEKNKNPNYVLVKLIDEEKMVETRDIYLYYLPQTFQEFESYVVRVQMANIKPKDKDIFFSELASSDIRKLAASVDNIYFRANVLMSMGNTIIVESVESCQELTSIGGTVVLNNFKDELLKLHAIPNLEHTEKLKQIFDRDSMNHSLKYINEKVDKKIEINNLVKPQWAHLDEKVEMVYFASAENPDKFFIRLEKFNDCLDLLVRDIQKYVDEHKGASKVVVEKEAIVLAEFPDDKLYYRARIDEVINESEVTVFFVDHGDWRKVKISNLVEISNSIISKMPFQAIECRLLGLKPFGENWTEFSTNWFCDQCYIGTGTEHKELYAQSFIKEKATSTGGTKYGVILIDTFTESDVIINKSMIENNMAQEIAHEAKFFDDVVLEKPEKDWSEDDIEVVKPDKEILDLVATKSPNNYLFQKPIRSMPLVSSEDSLDKWDIELSKEELKSVFQINTPSVNVKHKNIPTILPNKDVPTEKSETSSRVSDFEVISPKIVKELDSDDLTSPETTEVNVSKTNLDIKESSTKRIPKVVWRQNINDVTIKIELIGVEKYTLDIKERGIKFATVVHDTEYEFELNLYGVVDIKKSNHASKGLYILIKLIKLIPKRWLALTKDGGIKKWIVYDPDSVNTSDSSDSDEEKTKDNTLEMIKHDHFNDTDDDDDEMSVVDDLNVKFN